MSPFEDINFVVQVCNILCADLFPRYFKYCQSFEGFWQLCLTSPFLLRVSRQVCQGVSAAYSLIICNTSTLSKYLLNSEFCVVLIFSVYAWIFVCRSMVYCKIHFSAVYGVSSFAIEICGLICCNPSPNNYPCASVFSIVRKCKSPWYLSRFAHQRLKLKFLLFGAFF